jgi:hypothetical protein
MLDLIFNILQTINYMKSINIKIIINIINSVNLEKFSNIYYYSNKKLKLKQSNEKRFDVIY